MSGFENILVERRGRAGLITLNRPEALNALNTAMMHDVVAAATRMDQDPGVGAIVITGSERAFAAGADIREMASNSFVEMYTSDWFFGWSGLVAVRKPLIAAVAGHALGGGCELAMMCDLIIAADTAKFGQPEIKLGVIPGIGGSQRLIRAIGKAKAMDMILTGRTMDAAEAERAGLVARVVPAGQVVDEAVEAAQQIASYSLPATMLAKEATNAAYEVPLAEGLRLERRLFHSIFATEDQKEGMSAFLEKRPASFSHR